MSYIYSCCLGFEFIETFLKSHHDSHTMISLPKTIDFDADVGNEAGYEEKMVQPEE